jgi:hypothetical protein
MAAPGMRQLPRMTDAERRARARKLLLKTLGQEEMMAGFWMLHPDGKVTRLLGALATVGTVYILFLEPYLVAFNVLAVAPEVVRLSTLVDFALGLHLLASFLTGYHYLASDGVQKLEMRTARAAWHYLSGWFVVDAMAAFPVQLFMLLVDPSTAVPGFGLALLRALQLAKCVRGARILGQLRARERASVVHYHRYALARFALLAAVGTHWLACVWFVLVARVRDEQRSYPEDPEVCANRWKLLPATVLDRYTCAMYWVAQTAFGAGLGDVLAINPGERLFVMAAMAAGALLVGALLLSAFARAAATLEHRFAVQRQATRTLAYLEARGIDAALRRDAAAYLDYRWASCGGHSDLDGLATCAARIPAPALCCPACQRVAEAGPTAPWVVARPTGRARGARRGGDVVRASGRLPLHERVLGLHALTRRGLAEDLDFCAARGARDWGFWKLLLSEAREKVYTKGARLIRERDPPDRLARAPPAPRAPPESAPEGRGVSD